MSLFGGFLVMLAVHVIYIALIFGFIYFTGKAIELDSGKYAIYAFICYYLKLDGLWSEMIIAYWKGFLGVQ